METYVVRVREPDRPVVPGGGSDLEGDLHGVVRHVRTGHETSFASWAELRTVLSGSQTASSERPATAQTNRGAP